MPILLPPSPFPPRRSLPNPAPRFARLPICTRSPHTSSAPRAPSAFLSGLAAHPHPSIARPAHPIRAPLRPRHTSAPFHPSPRAPHPRAPPASSHIRILPSRSLAPRPRAPPASPHIRILPSLAPRTPSARPSGLAAHPHPSIPRPSHPVRAPLRPRRTSAPFHPAPSPHPRTPAYLLGYIPPHIRRSPSSSSLYVYRRS